MENPNQLKLEDAVLHLRGNDWFQVVLAEMVKRREDSIKDLADYKDDTELRKHAAKITVYTELLDDFEVPMGSPMPPAAD